ncbi:hypothetical protein NLI96_g10293 [Meripilus lineatus]|uniref:Uncharacterized protein n=1 Tax=Meripilus lineatus TaxID=2056292 RepID=A0AAD5UU70_9APHY|nr:hypothetical protein NLI96_g10293 [Physisporinus lineatus]
MVKPTLVQTLLNRPTQTYHFPHSKEYHSSKQDFIRASTQSTIDRGCSELVPGPSPMHPQDTHNNSNNLNGHVRSSTASVSSYHSVPSSSVSSLSAVTAASSPSQTPSMRPDTAKQSHHPTPDTKRTPRSVASSTSNRNAQLPEKPTVPVTSQPKRMTSPPSAYNRQVPSKPIQSQSKQQSDAEGDDEDDESDVFYTPRSSLYSSPRTSRASANAIVDQKSITSALAPVVQTRSRSARASRTSASGSRTPSTASILSIPSTASSSSLGDLGSIIPSSFGTNSTRLTSPLFSDNGGLNRQVPTNGQAQSRQPQKSNSVETITIASSSPSKRGSQSSSMPTATATTTTTVTQQPSQQQQSTPPRGRPRPLSASSNNRKRRNQAETQPQTYADEDWAKDVRWLAPAIREVPSVPSPRNNYRPMSSEGAASPRASGIPSRTYAAPQKTYPPAAKSAERRQRTSRHSRGSRSSRGRMSALMEEDESDFSDLTPGASSQESRPPSPVMEEAEGSGGGGSRSVTPTASSLMAVRSTVTRSYSAKVPKTTARTITSSPEPIAEAKSGAPSIAATSETEDSLELNPDARLRAYARSPGGSRRTYSHTRPLSRSSTLTQTTFAANSITDPSIFAKGLPTHALPTPFPTTSSASTSYSSGANYNGGYTGLTMAHAGYVNKGKATLNDGKVDLAKAGIAQSSMATVEVVRGVAQAQTSSNTSSPRKKRRALSFSLKALGSVVVGKARGKGKHKEETPAHLLDALPLPVAFTAHIPPPSYVPSSYVLLQVFAVGLDALDSLLVQEEDKLRV